VPDATATTIAAAITSVDGPQDTMAAALDAHAMNLYSRQIGAYGVEAMSKLIKLRILLVNVRGLGIETAKNLVLAGPGALTIFDPNPVAASDVGVNFFTQADDVGKNRAEVCAPRLQELNRLVQVRAAPVLDESVVKAHSALVVTRMPHAEAERWNAFCRANNIGFFNADVLGACGFVFVDLGDAFFVRDLNGEQAVSRIVASISNEPQAIVSLLPPPDGKRHNIEDTEHEGWVAFDEVEGMGPAIVTNGPFRAHHMYKDKLDAKTGKTTRVFDPYALRLDVDTSVMGTYVSGGRMTQVKKPVKLGFASLAQSTAAPGALLFTDGQKIGRAEQLHVAFRALWAFESERNALHCHSDDDVARVVALAQALDANVDVSVVVKVARGSAWELQPLCAFFGGVLAQEVIKMTGKFSPLQQWLHLDAFEVLAASDAQPYAADSDLVALLGSAVADKLRSTSTFVVGCGALGCEFLKNFALLGVATQGDGVVTVTDNDRIEVSNLSRQFLFREDNVGQAKSTAAARAAQRMNPAFRVTALEQLVAPATESTFDDAFWGKLAFVTNALDNVKARLYVDSRCVFYGKPLVDSGTLGTKCNVQVVVPNLTQSYADGPADGDEGDAIPMCTLRNFPSQPEHCIEWARALFTDLFSAAAQEAANVAADRDGWLSAMRAKTLALSSQTAIANASSKELKPLQDVVALVRIASTPEEQTFERCVRDAHALFFQHFRDRILSLQKAYPADHVDSKGRPFWSGTKRFPQAAMQLDLSNADHFGFIVSVANLLAFNRGLVDGELPADHAWRKVDTVKAALEGMEAPELELQSVDMSGGGEELEAPSAAGAPAAPPLEASGKKARLSEEASDVAKLTVLLAELATLKPVRRIEAADFEKDHDLNFHIDFVTAATNMRAWNYRLAPNTRHQVKMIAGKIIPAVATTTAAVCGLAVIEMIKIVQGKPLEELRDSSNSLGVNAYYFSEPVPPQRAKDEYDPIEMADVRCVPKGFTKWDKTRLVMDSPEFTLQNVLDAFKAATGLTLTQVLHSNANIEGAKGASTFLYERDSFGKKKEEYDAALSNGLVALAVDVYGEDAIRPARRFVTLETSQVDDDDLPCKVPTVVVAW